jgi:hypothetical protein
MGTEKQEKPMVSITSYLHLKDTKPSGNLKDCFSGSLAFSQGQIPTHTGKVPLLAPTVMH